MSRHRMNTEAPYTKSARHPSPKPINTAFPAVPSLRKAFAPFRRAFLTRGDSTTKGVRPPSFPRWYRPVKSPWSVSDPPLVKFSDAEARSHDKIAHESLAIASFSDQCLAAIRTFVSKNEA